MEVLISAAGGRTRVIMCWHSLNYEIERKWQLVGSDRANFYSSQLMNVGKMCSPWLSAAVVIVSGCELGESHQGSAGKDGSSPARLQLLMSW